MGVLAVNTYRQTATYWGAPKPSRFGGNTYSAPITTLVRWEDKAEVYTDATGEEKTSRGKVHTVFKTEVGGYLCKGDHNAADPTTLTGAIRIERSDEIPDLRGLNQDYLSWL